METVIVLDVANATTALGAFEGERLAATWRFGTDPQRTADDYGLLLRQALAGRADGLAGAVVGSVVPALTATICQACARYVGVAPLVLGPGVKSGIRIRTDNPRELGADRIANAVAASRRHGLPAVVVDFATATTFDVLGAGGDYLGTVIAPGLALAAEALAREAAQLRGVELRRPPHVVGRSTVEALQSGLIYGFAGLVEGIVLRLREEIGAACRVVATGPLATEIRSATSVIDVVDPDLTLHGLRLIWELNRS